VNRYCDGNDPNLTRQVHEIDFMPDRMTISETWKGMARPGMVVILCACGTRFDDELRMTTYPHEYIGQKPLPFP
jgi:hypothetical protein